MNSPDKTAAQDRQARKQAGAKVAPDKAIAPRDTDAAALAQQAGGAHKPQQFSQQIAQDIPADPDPDDPVSP